MLKKELEELCKQQEEEIFSLVRKLNKSEEKCKELEDTNNALDRSVKECSLLIEARMKTSIHLTVDPVLDEEGRALHCEHTTEEGRFLDHLFSVLKRSDRMAWTW